jgi:hypothetical protein
MNRYGYRRTGKFGVFIARRRVLGWMPWHFRKRQQVLEGYALDRDDAMHLEAFLRSHAIEAFVCPSVEDEATFSVAIWAKDRKRVQALAATHHPRLQD